MKSDDEEINRLLSESDKHLNNANRNLAQVEWMWKWLIIPMWVIIIILHVARMILLHKSRH